MANESINELNVDGGAAVGRNLRVSGGVTVGRNLKVEGWLDAPNVKGPAKGLFADEEALLEAYPDSTRENYRRGTLHVGDWAACGASSPYEVWTVRWVDGEMKWEKLGTMEIKIDSAVLEAQFDDATLKSLRWALSTDNGMLTATLGDGTLVTATLSAANANFAGLMTKEHVNVLGDLQTQVAAHEQLLSGNATDAIESLNEVIDFLEGIKDETTLSGLLLDVQNDIEDLGKIVGSIDYADIDYEDSSKMRTAFGQGGTLVKVTGRGWLFNINSSLCTAIYQQVYITQDYLEDGELKGHKDGELHIYTRTYNRRSYEVEYQATGETIAARSWGAWREIAGDGVLEALATVQAAATAAAASAKAAEQTAKAHETSVSIHPIAGVARNVYDEASGDYDPTALGITYLQDEQKFVNVIEDDTESAPTYTVEKGDYGTSGVRRNLLKRTNCGAGYGEPTASGFYRNGWVAYGYNASTEVNAVAISEGAITQLGTNTRVGQYARFTHSQGLTCTSEYIAFPIRPDIIKAGEKYTVSLVVVDGIQKDDSPYPLLQFKAQICDITAANPLTDQVATTSVKRVANGSRITATLTATADGTADGSQYLMLYIASECLDKWEYFSVFDLKLERGETATAWCCAPEDITPTTTEEITDSLYNVNLLAIAKPSFGEGGTVSTLGASTGLWRANTAKIYRHKGDLFHIGDDYTVYKFNYIAVF